MVTIIHYEKRTSKEETPYFVLILQGDIEMIQSQESGRFYATARKCTINSTFDESTCKRMIGKTLPGVIDKVPCEAYEYNIATTGEKVMLSHTYVYKPNPIAIDQPLFQNGKAEVLSC